MAAASGAGVVLFGYRVRPLAAKVGSEILDDNLLGLAAATAYNFFFALFPTLLFLAPMLSLVGDKQALMNDIIQRVAPAIPPDALALVRGVVRDVVLAKNAPGLISIGALLALYASSNVFVSLMDALSRAYDTSDSRSWWKQRLIGVACAIGGAIAIGAATIVLLAGAQVVQGLASLLGLGPVGAVIWRVLQYPLAFTLLVGFLWLVYYVLPPVRLRKGQTLAGAVIAATLWVLVTWLFRLYVSNFGAYNRTYGTVGAAIVLLTWMYLTMLVILSVGELNSELHNGTGSLAPRGGVLHGGRIVTGEGGAEPSGKAK